MNQNIKHLSTIAQKQERLIIGLMSGTSLDGLDVALCKFRGSGMETQIEVINFETVPYTEEIKSTIKYHTDLGIKGHRRLIYRLFFSYLTC